MLLTILVLVAHERNSSPRIVGVQEVLVDLVDRFLPSPKLVSIHELSFEQSTHAFGRRVVRAGPNSSHTDLQTVPSQTLTIGIARVLATMIRMPDRTMVQRSLGPCSCHR